MPLTLNRNRYSLAIALAGLALLIGNVAAAASTYYIDSQGGSDRNDGRAEATPWKSHTMAHL